MVEGQPYPIGDIPSKTKIEQMVRGGNMEDAEKIGDELFRNKNYVEAIKVYQEMIENGYTVDFDIEGLGNAEQSISRYEWFVYRWYDEQRKSGKVKGNAFDALSLCFSLIRNSNDEEADRGILWYEDMIAERNCDALQIGYANLLYNRARYE
jgi:pentatricopeptide repeat protein